MKVFRPVWAAMIFAGFALSLQAGVITSVAVDGQAMPWLWVNGGLNTTFQFGSQDGVGPAIVDGSSGVSFVAGTHIVISYLNGLTGAFPGDPPVVDGIGYGPNPPSPFVFDASDNIGNSGHVFPSFYMTGYPIYLNALVGTFADASGNVVGTPFAVRNGPIDVFVPVGATRLQFGFNDDIFADNSGFLNVQVSDAVPEPSFALGVGALAGAMLLVRARRIA